jgi:hydroxyquinol 1,2-dioxygenase
MTTGLASDELTTAVPDSFVNTQDARLREIIDSLVRHLHGFVAKINPSIGEWERAIEFLTATGKTCTDVRQEFILLSDVLGVSMMVETINDAETTEATASAVLGPFHMTQSPIRELGDDISPDSTSVQRCVVRGRVRAPDVQTAGNGRGLLTADANGEFWFRTVVPAHYPIPTGGPVGALLAATGRHPLRPAHIHFLVSSPGYRELTTHIFIDGSQFIDSDAVFAAKQSLLKEFRVNDDQRLASRLGVIVPVVDAQFDIDHSAERSK